MKFFRICSLILPVATLFTFSARADITTGLVGYWTDDTANVSGTTAIDSSAYRNNGSLVGTPAIVTGKIAQAVNLTTTSQMVSVPDTTSINLTGPFTVAVWVNFTALPGSSQYPNVVAKLTSPSSYYGYGLFWSGTGVAGIIGPGSAKWYMTSAYRPTTGVWTHYAAVFDGTYLRLYINGAQYSQVTATAPGTTATIPIKMGPHYSNPSAYGVINGKLDDVRVYNRALASADITQLYGYTSGCTYAITPSSSAFASAAGSGSVNVTAGAGCSWTASSGASWITVTAGASGTANGTVNYSVAANTSTGSRSGTLTIAGQTCTVSQAAAGGCSYAISPGSAAFASTSGNGSVSVTAGAGCSWTATSGATWITITGGGSGTGNGTVSYSVAANTGTSSRAGTLTVAGKSFSVTQNGVCSYAITPAAYSCASGGGSGSVSVTAGSTCFWTATSGASWITISSGSAGTGNGAVYYSVAANTATSSRSGTMTVAGKTFTVTQAAAALTGDTTPPSVSLTAPSGGSTLSGTASLSASASDNVGVSKVEFYRDNTVLVGTATTAPYSVSWNSSSAANGSHSLCAKAYDGAGNWTTSAGSSVTVNNSTSSTAGQLQWVNTMLTTRSGVTAMSTGVAIDGSGNVIAVGAFNSTMILGSITKSPSSGGWNGFVVKYTLQGSLVWLKTLGSGVGNCYASGVTVDGQGNIIVAGYFFGTADFGGVTLTAPDPYYAQATDMFVAKYGPTGSLLWVVRFGGNTGAVATGVGVDSGNNILLAGYISSPTTFGSITVPNAANNSLAVAKLSSAGQVLWARSWGSSGSTVQSSGLAVDATGNVAVTGSFHGNTDIGGGTMSATSAGQTVFLAKYSGVDGSAQWAKGFGGSGNSAGMSVAIDPNTANIVVGGGVTGAANFGGGSVPGGPGESAFLAGYSPSGSFLWVNTFGGTVSGEHNQINAVRIDARGNLVFTGGKGGPWYVWGSWKYSTLLAAGCTISGNSAPILRWFDTPSSGTTGAATGSAIAFDAFSHVIAAGSFNSGIVNFGGISATSPAGGYSGWVAQYSN